MAKSTHSRSRRPAQQSEPEQEIQQRETPAAPSATAVAEQPAPAQQQSAPAGKSGDDVASFDAETNAKYEQVKGGKLYIKDLQQMDIIGLHEIARQENIQDYIGLKKQDLIFQILRARIRQNGLMYG